MENKEVLLEAKDLRKYFIVEKHINRENNKILKAVDGVNLTLHKGEILGLVGESGCGKSTLGRTLLRMYPVTSGKVIFCNEDITNYSTKQMYDKRKKMQMVFQDPYSSLNPRMTVYQTIYAALKVHNIGTKEERIQKVKEILKDVGLGENQLNKYPHEMSGGQRQRVAIARAIAPRPDFIVCDEPVSALDVSVRSQVLNLLKDLQERYGMSYLFISHDLSVVRYLCDRVIVMYLGKIIEEAPKMELFTEPGHPYTKALLSAIPIPDVNIRKEKIILSGDMPSPIDPPKGCRFHTRCPYSKKICTESEPEFREWKNGHKVACHRIEEI